MYDVVSYPASSLSMDIALERFIWLLLRISVTFVYLSDRGGRIGSGCSAEGSFLGDDDGKAGSFADVTPCTCDSDSGSGS